MPVHSAESAFQEAQSWREVQRSFGKGLPFLCAKFRDVHVVLIGNQLVFLTEVVTFHDFLFAYMIRRLAPWGADEMSKSFDERHPIFQWFSELKSYQAALGKRDGELFQAVATGPVMAYLATAFDLYTIDRNQLLQSRLLQRLMHKDQFQGARYEVYVAAAIVRAGFKVEFEDETDIKRSHCEFVATHPTGKKFSVEAKSRGRQGILGKSGQRKPDDSQASKISGLLRRALVKHAEHERIVFIDVNMPPHRRRCFRCRMVHNCWRRIKDG